MAERSRSGSLGPRRLVVAVAAVAALAGACWWWADSGDLREPPPAEAARAPLLAAPPAPGPAAVVAQEERAPVHAGSESTPDEGAWIRGRLVLPPNTPAGEVVRVLISGRRPRSSAVSTPVEADGTFRGRFPAGSRGVVLELDAPHLFMDPVMLALDPPPGELVLEPRLGGRVVGRILAPAGAEDAAAVLSGLTMRLWNPAERARSVHRTSSVDAEGRFELRGVPPDMDWKVGLESCPWRIAREPLVQVSAGQTRSVDFDPTLGVRLSGRVLDDGGGDLEKVFLSTGSGDADSFSGLGRISVAADGTFDARGLAPGPCKLRAHIPGRLAAMLDLGQLHDGQHVEGLELRVAAGTVIAGRVLWGTTSRPAAGVKVYARYANAVTDEEGRFRILGLAPHQQSHMHVEAEPPQDLAVAEGKWLAKAERVKHGTEDLLLRLEPGLTLKGEVRDDLGRPAAEVEIDAWMYVGSGSQQVSKCTSGPDGSFVLTGLWPERITLSAGGKGYGSITRVPADPRKASTMKLTLPRVGSVSGLVLGPDGQPAEGADVGARNSGVRARSDSAGRFRLVDCSPGFLELYAWRHGDVGSEVLQATLKSGQILEDAVLRLRAGTRLTGELSPALAPLGGRRIEIRGSGLYEAASTDGNGHFLAVGLPPGEYEVSLDEHRGEGQRSNTVKVITAEGSAPHVVLVAAPVAAQIRIFGKVSGAAGPVAGYSVKASEAIPGGWRSRPGMSASTDLHGEYQMLVDAGQYSFWVEGPGSSTRSSVHDVPAGSSYRLDFQLEAGSLHGRVVGPDGEARANVLVFLQLEGADRQGPVHAIRAQAFTRDDGTFAFEHLRDGSYQLFATPSPFLRTPDALGAMRLSGFEVESGGRIDGVELCLPQGGALTGTVRAPDGSPAAGVEIFLQGDLASPMRMSPGPMTDLDGRYSIAGLAPGNWSAYATDGKRLVSQESEPVHVDADTVELDLALVHGTTLLILCEDDAGHPLPTGARVLDARGRSHSNRWLTAPAPADLTQQRIGPLAPGVYHISREGEDGTSASLEITLAGEPEREVTLRLKKP